MDSQGIEDHRAIVTTTRQAPPETPWDAKPLSHMGPVARFIIMCVGCWY